MAIEILDQDVLYFLYIFFYIIEFLSVIRW